MSRGTPSKKGKWSGARERCTCEARLTEEVAPIHRTNIMDKESGSQVFSAALAAMQTNLPPQHKSIASFRWIQLRIVGLMPDGSLRHGGLRCVG